MKNGFKLSARSIIVIVLALVLFGGAFALVRYLTVTMRAVSGIPGASIQEEATQAAPDAPELPTAAPEAPAIDLPPTWDGASRVTVLLMGVDTEVRLDTEGNVSPDRQGPARSDTMILLTIDPQSKTAGMMSIPRDLWVKIPGFDYAKINTAYYNGEAYKLPGGGPELAMRTVEQVVGVPVQYYAQIQFWAFTRLIEDIGKVDIVIDKKIVIDPVGAGADDIVLKAGPHKLGGVEALAYVRQRHTEGGDVDRSKRQQQVIMAVRDKITDPANFTTLLANAPDMYNEIQTGVRTNLTFNDIMRLGMLVKDIPLENIKRGVISYDMLQLDSVVVNGEAQSIVKPIPDKIRVLRDEIFSSAGAVGPLAQGDSLQLAVQEGATIGIYNASSIQGLAQRTADYLKSLGLNVILVDNAGYYPGVTQAIDHRGRLYTLRYFKELCNLNAGAQIIIKSDASAPADIDLVIADDWGLNNPMP